MVDGVCSGYGALRAPYAQDRGFRGGRELRGACASSVKNTHVPEPTILYAMARHPILLVLFTALFFPSCEMLSDPAFIAGLNQGLQQLNNNAAPTPASYSPAPATFPSASSPSMRTTPSPPPPTPRVASAPRTASAPAKRSDEDQAKPQRPRALLAVWEYVNKSSWDRGGFTGPCQRGAVFWPTREKAMDLADASSKSNPQLIHQFHHHGKPDSNGKSRHYHVFVYDLQRPLETWETDIRGQLRDSFGYTPSR